MFKRGDIVRIVDGGNFTGAIAVVVGIKHPYADKHDALCLSPIYAPDGLKRGYDWVKHYLFNTLSFKFEKLCEVEVEPNEEKEHD